MSVRRMQFWVIQHEPTGDLMRVMPSNKGYTYWEPGPSSSPPRLFSTEGGAKRALDWYLNGKVVRKFTHSGDFWGEDDHETWDVIPVPDRRANDFHVVPVTLEVVT